jgi:hypothetical protein
MGIKQVSPFEKSTILRTKRDGRKKENQIQEKVQFWEKEFKK